MVEFAHSETGDLAPPLPATLSSPFNSLARLDQIDWDFTSTKTKYLTHGIHPYPAKFIPQIPNALIQELSSVGETVADIFCGSGTTLVEALTLKRNAFGVDANPLASLISKVKTTPLGEEDFADLTTLAKNSKILGQELSQADDDLFHSRKRFYSRGFRPDQELTDFWFEPHVVEELAEALKTSSELYSERARQLALVAFSSIVVAVSKQDSDTRYVRREKHIRPGDTLIRFGRALDQTISAVKELSNLVENRFKATVENLNILDAGDVEPFDLLICSPPYPNAYSYHLYHRTRMLWLKMDQQRFKAEEIGSHRKYSRKGSGRATEETFAEELTSILSWTRQHLRDNRFACFVVGDSTLNGKTIDNAELLSRVASTVGFREVKRIRRQLQATKKAFNPAIGKIKTEKLVILKRV